MSAGLAMQAAIIAAVSDVDELAGVYDGPPARATFPYLTVDAGLEQDWSHKTGQGREVVIALTLWDDQPSRVRRLGDLVEQRMQMLRGINDWQLVALRFNRKRVVRDVAGPWAVALDYRARMLAQD